MRRLHRMGLGFHINDFGSWGWGCMQPSLRFCMHFRSRKLIGVQALKGAHAADRRTLVCPYGAAALARGLRSPEHDTLAERTRALHRRPPEHWPGERSLLKNLGLRVAPRSACPPCMKSLRKTHKVVLRTRPTQPVSEGLSHKSQRTRCGRATSQISPPFRPDGGNGQAK